MIYLNNFIPIRVYYNKTLDMYRLVAPYADRPQLEYDEEFIKTKLMPAYELKDTIYALNPRLFPPVPVGAVMFSVYQNHVEPYQTIYVEWIAFPVMTNVFSEIGNFSFFAFINSPSRDALPMYIRNEKDHTMVSLEKEKIGNYFDITPYYKKALDRDNYVVYVFSHVSLYWRSTTECLCVPSDNPKDYATLVECQRATYHMIKNKKSYTGNSSIPLSILRDKIFPVKSTNRHIYPYLLVLVVCGIVVALLYQLRAQQKTRLS